MQQKITLIGSTGLIGSNFLEVINNEDYQSVTAITRSRILNLDEKDFIKQSVHDFSNLEKMRKDLKTDVLVCALETTIFASGNIKNCKGRRM